MGLCVLNLARAYYFVYPGRKCYSHNGADRSEFSNSCFVKISFLSLAGFMVFAVSQASAATLVVSPSAANINVGGSFRVNILLDTEGAEIHGVDVNALNYDPSILEVQDGKFVEFVR